MRLMLLGINHRTAPVEVRERLALGGEQLGPTLSAWCEHFAGAEAVMLSTCNRTELYIARPHEAEPSIEQVRAFLAQQTDASIEALTAASVHREQGPAVHHLLRVTAGLDAMAVGESQVLGQVKRAYESAQQAGTAGPVLNRLFQQALAEAKQARQASGIDMLRHSISSMAVDFASDVFDSFEDKTVVGIGAGEITKATLRRMLELRPGKMWVVNRSADRGLALARGLGLVGSSDGARPADSQSLIRDLANISGGARPWEAMEEVLVEADVVLTATGASEPIVTEAGFAKLIKRRRNRPIFMIDMAVPRDIEPSVGTLPNVYLYNIDDLQQALDQSPHRRESIQACEDRVRDAADRCLGALQHQDLGVLVRQLRGKLLAIGEQERARTRKKMSAMLPEYVSADTGEAVDHRDQVDALGALLDEHTHRLINKVLHLPLRQLGPEQKDAPLGFYAAALRKLFDLDGMSGESGEKSAADEERDADVGSSHD